MKLPVASLFSQELVQNLCWTLIHSLWQGLVLAILAGLVVQFTRTSTPVLRYNLLTGLFVLFLVCSGVTFWLGFGPKGTLAAEVPTASALGQVLQSVTTTSLPQTGAPSTSWLNAFTHFCTAHAPAIVLLWFLVFAFKALQLLSGLQYVAKLRREKTGPVSGFWNSRVVQLAQMLQMGLPVQLLESALVKTPVVIGFLKPLILVPTGMLAQLPVDQVEAILLHELAHIYRRDYLVNLLQTLAEVVFFFNPAVLWISGTIRQERENCCDDVAIQVMQSKSHYLQALVTFQEYSFTQYGLSSGFADTRTSLTSRVKRIIYRNNLPLAKSEKWFVAGCFVLVAALFLHFARPALPQAIALPSVPLEIFLPKKNVTVTPASEPKREQIKMATAAKKPAKKPSSAKADSIILPVPQEVFISEGAARKSSDGKTTKYQFRKGGILYEVERDTATVVAMKINGEPIKQEEVQRYENLMNDLLLQYEQGTLKIVVNGKAPQVTSELESNIQIAFLQNGTIITNHNDTTYVVQVKNHKLVQFKINASDVADEELSRHSHLIQRLVKEAQDDRAYAELTVRAAIELFSANTGGSPDLVSTSDAAPQDLPESPHLYHQHHSTFNSLASNQMEASRKHLPFPIL